MADSSVVRRATLVATSKVASEFGETAVLFLQTFADIGGDHCRADSWWLMADG